MFAQGDIHRYNRFMGKGFAGNVYVPAISPRRAQIDAHVQRPGPGIDPQGADEHGPLCPQAHVPCQTVPVGLGLVGGRGGVDDVRPGEARITVVGEQRKLGTIVDETRHLKHLRGAQRGWFKGWNRPIIHIQAQTAGALHLEENARFRGQIKVQPPAQSNHAFIGVPARQPRGNGPVQAHGGVAQRLVRVPDVRARVRVPDAAFIQCSGNADIPLESRH